MALKEPGRRGTDARGVERRIVLLVFVVAFALCALLTKAHVTGWNDGSRFATVDALTSNHTFAIDGSPFTNGLGDKIRVRGITYSDKPPLLAIAGAGIATVLGLFGISLRHTPGTAIYLITLLTIGGAFGVGCAYAYAFARRLGFGRRLAMSAAALTGVGTLVLPYATVFTNHVPCGAAALAGAYHLVRARDGAGRQAAVAGAFFALSYACDAAGAVFALTAAMLLWGLPLRSWVLCALAGLPFVVLQLAYNHAITGSVMPPVFNARVWSDPSLPLHSWSSQVFEIYSPADYAGFAVNLLVGAKGLFSFTPVMLVAAGGFVVMLRAEGVARRVAIAVLTTFGVYFLLIVFLQNDLFARNFGERRYVDQFFLLGTAFAPALAAVRGLFASLAVRLVCAVSVAIAALGTIVPFGGGPGESGLVFGPAAFVSLAQRAHVSAVADVVLLLVLLALIEWLVPLPASPRPQRA